MTIDPAGNLALLWQEMSQAGSDAHYRVLDPASATWSRDAQLFNDSPLERSFAPVWDDVGNLTVAYNKVQILHTNKTVTLERGAHAPSRVLTGALAGQSGAGAGTNLVHGGTRWCVARGRATSHAGACAPHGAQRGRSGIEQCRGGVLRRESDEWWGADYQRHDLRSGTTTKNAKNAELGNKSQTEHTENLPGRPPPNPSSSLCSLCSLWPTSVFGLNSSQFFYRVKVE